MWPNSSFKFEIINRYETTNNGAMHAGLIVLVGSCLHATDLVGSCLHATDNKVAMATVTKFNK